MNFETWYRRTLESWRSPRHLSRQYWTKVRKIRIFCALLAVSQTVKPFLEEYDFKNLIKRKFYSCLVKCCKLLQSDYKNTRCYSNKIAVPPGKNNANTHPPGIEKFSKLC